MDVEEAYGIWSDQYDKNENKTRDLEAIALKATLANLHFACCLEIGCGTGKNTNWLLTKSKKVVAIDLSAGMLAKAKEKIKDPRASFHQTDIRKEWSFVANEFDLITFSLVLEHVENLLDVFEKVARVTQPGSYVYVSELHPFKQYTGAKAGFKTEHGIQTVECFNHNISDFTSAAKRNGFRIIEIEEYFDDNNRANIPRIMTLLFKKEGAQ